MESGRDIRLTLAAPSLLWMAASLGHGMAGERRASDYLNTAPDVQYVGDERCRSCHPSEFANFKRSGMGRSMRLPSVPGELGQLASPVTLHGADPGVSYRIYAAHGKVFHSEQEVGGKGVVVSSEAHELAYSVGSGNLGRSYLIARGDSLFVSPLSYYASENRWDLSPGHDTGLYRGFNRPAGDLCLYCHGGLQAIAGTFNRFRLPPTRGLAIGCERCHGPGQLHVARRSAGAARADPIDRSIVNPAKLAESLRDDVCNQCHLAGDARVLKPDRKYDDFRPGTPLDNVVTIFSVPATLKAAGLQALGQVDQLHLSRCWTASRGRMGCITCHDPHVEPRGQEAVAFFRKRCLTCHASEACTVSMAKRQQTQPPDSCTGCHMPQRGLTNIGHTALTDHRILRSEGAAVSSAPASPSGSPELVRETLPLPNASGQSPDDLRSLALAYAQVAEHYPSFAEEGFTVLERAALTFSHDAEVQATYGLVLLAARPSQRSEAETALEQAVELGSNSIEARLRLAGLFLEDDNPNAAVKLCEDVVRMDPYLPSAYLRLARAYGILGDHQKAVSTLERLLGFDPGNKSARRALEAERRDRIVR